MNKNPFVKGQTVRARISKKVGTVIAVPEAAGEGLVEIRFDGDTGSTKLHFSRFEALDIRNIDVTCDYDPYLFRKGDFVRVITEDKEVFEGTAMTDMQDVGSSLFELLTMDGKLLDFNYNFVEAINLFRADIARGETPKF